MSQYQYSHGEAIALGMTAAVFMSHKLGMLDDESRKRIIRVLELAGLPTGKLKISPKVIADAMLFDKKVKGGKIRFILLDGIGRAVIRDDVPAELVLAAVESLHA